MKRLNELYNLEDLRVLCEDRSRVEGATLSEAVAFATKHTNSDLGFISVVDFTDERWLHSKERFLFSPMPGGYRHNQRFSLQIGGQELPRKDRSLSGLAAFTRKSYRCGNVKNDAFYLSMNDDVLSEVVAPIEYKGILLGVVNLESYRQDHYHQAHENFLRCVAKRIAEPLARFRRREREEYIEHLATKDFLTLYQQRHSTSQDFLHAALQQITQRVKVLRATARIKDDKKLALRACYPGTMQFSDGPSPEDLFFLIGTDDLPPEERSLVGYVGHTKQMQRLPDVRQFKYFYDIDGQGRSVLCVPILFDSTLLAAIPATYLVDFSSSSYNTL